MGDEPAAWDLGGNDDAKPSRPSSRSASRPGSQPLSRHSSGRSSGVTTPGGTKHPKEQRPKLDYSIFAKAPKPEYTLHWVRPLFLNYRYLWNYRQFYYNDVIDYLDKRNRGIWREPPNAEEWSERMFKVYDAKNTNRSYKRSADMRWLTQYRTEPRYYSYHTRAYYSLKYQKIL